MSTWIETIEESTQLFSPIGLRLIDDLTGNSPIGRIQAILELQDAGGEWKDTKIAPVITVSGTVTYPGLERHADATGKLPKQFRVRLKPEFYVPLYQRDRDGLLCTAFPYDNSHPPQNVKQLPDDVILTPATNYPFEGQIPVARGMVVDAANASVPNAVVTQGAKERVLTDQRGCFALPLRWVKPNPLLPIDAANERNGQQGTTNIQFPQDLSKNIKIQFH